MRDFHGRQRIFAGGVPHRDRIFCCGRSRRARDSRYRRRLYRRADWQWALFGVPCNANGWPTQAVEDVTIIHGGTPENGFISYRYQGYDEFLLMHVLGFGSSTFPLPPACYRAWQKTLQWRNQYGIEYLHAGPLFIHQLSHCWLDFCGIVDAFMHSKGIDYFENSRRAVQVQQKYAQQNPQKFRGFGPLC